MGKESKSAKGRRLIVLFGDQLNADAKALEGADPARDTIVMMEVAEEATYVPQHKKRLVLFFSAMRHFRADLEARGFRMAYSRLDDADNTGSFAGELNRRIAEISPDRIVATMPGDHRVLTVLDETARETGTPLNVLDDAHFLSTPVEFDRFAEGRKSLVMEMFYRGMRRKTGWLMDGDKPVGGDWNYDADNRESLKKSGPEFISTPREFAPDDVTSEVIGMVELRFPDAPGTLDSFDLPVTAADAQEALDDFIENRLPDFGRYQDAMKTGEAYLFHSRLSAAMNLHLLDPRTVIDAAIAACEDGRAPINSVEGFVRQILGWREYVRGIYWRKMPGYAELNALDADLPMPAFMWTAETDMACVRASVEQLIDTAYAHHIQRLMVLGLFAMLLGVRPYDVHRWHMSMYADAIDWVSLPNVLGMSQYGDGGIVGTKPYAASGAYIDRMSDYCAGCRFDPKKATGDDACPFTTLYWDFLDRHDDTLRANRRMGFQYRNLDRKDAGDVHDIRRQADRLKADLTAKTYL